MSYEDLRAQMPGTVNQISKLAQMDMQEEQLEQDFSKLAYMFVSDRAAQLMRYILGFEVVEHEPDGSKAVGVFGFKVGEDFYYIPAFFITNQVRGVDMIYSKKTNTFFPLTEEWIDNIIQRDAIELGDAADAKSVRPDFENPNFDFIRRPSVGAAYGSKTAAARDAEGYDEFAECTDGKSLFKAAWDAMCVTTAEKVASDPAMQEALAGFVGKVNGKELSKKAESGDLAKWLSEQGGPAAVSSLFDALCTNVKFANAALTVYPNIESLHVHQFRETAIGCKKAEEPKLRVVEKADESTSDADRQRLLVNGFYIDDKRDPQNLSRTYEYDHAATFGTVDGVGKYDVMTAEGTTQKAWVLEAIKTQESPRRKVVVTDPEGKLKMRGITTSDKIYAKGQRLADVDGLYDSGIPLSEMADEYTYLLLDKGGKNCIVGFRMTGATFIPGENPKVDGWLSGCCGDCCCEPCGSYGARDGEFDIYKGDPYRDRTGRLRPEHSGVRYSFRGLTLTKGTGKAVVAGDRILVPSNYKAIVLEAPYDVRDKAKEHQPSFSLGDLTSLKFEMEKAAFHDLSVIKDGPEFYVRVDDLGLSRPYGYKQACMSLNGRLGLSVEDTERILEKAAGDGEAKVHVHLGKAAQFVGVQMPAPPPEAPGADPYTGVPVYGPYEQAVQAPFYGAPPVPHGNPLGENIGGEGETQQGYGGSDVRGMPGGNAGSAPIDPEAMGLAAQAGELGQRHVFDYASIGGLAKVYDTGALIDTYIPQFMQAVDRLGRVLFLYYWKNEDFGERYGTSDTVELEDTLRSVFKQFGNLALVLRRKTIDAD